MCNYSVIIATINTWCGRGIKFALLSQSAIISEYLRVRYCEITDDHFDMYTLASINWYCDNVNPAYARDTDGRTVKYTFHAFDTISYKKLTLRFSTEDPKPTMGSRNPFYDVWRSRTCAAPHWLCSHWKAEDLGKSVRFSTDKRARTFYRGYCRSNNMLQQKLTTVPPIFIVKYRSLYR